MPTSAPLRDVTVAVHVCTVKYRTVRLRVAAATTDAEIERLAAARALGDATDVGDLVGSGWRWDTERPVSAAEIVGNRDAHDVSPITGAACGWASIVEG